MKFWKAGIALCALVAVASQNACDKKDDPAQTDDSAAKSESAKPAAGTEATAATGSDNSAGSAATEASAGSGEKASDQGSKSAGDKDQEAAGGDKKSVPELRREKLATVLKAVYCIQRNDSGGNPLPIYKEHGFDSHEDWNKAWQADAKKKPDWAKEQVAALAPEACQ